MALAFLIEVPNMTPEDGAAVLRELDLAAQPPAGQIFHLEGPMEGGGMRVVDVWESEEVFLAFVQERLAPAFARAGITMPADLQPKAVWPVTGIMK